MGYSTLYGIAAVAVLVAGVTAFGAMDSANWKPVKASVDYIDRNCQIIETSYDPNYHRTGSRTYTDSCSSLDEWQTVREKRTKVVQGTAVVHLSYTAPQTGVPETAELNFNGRDDEFYQLNAGDQIDILVNNDDPSKVKKA